MKRVKNKKGCRTQTDKWSVLSCINKSFDQCPKGRFDIAKSDLCQVLVVQRRFPFNKQGRNQSKRSTKQADINRKGSRSRLGRSKPTIIIDYHPKPRNDYPSPLTDPLGNSHNTRALMKVCTHLVSKCNIGYTKNC